MQPTKPGPSRRAQHINLRREAIRRENLISEGLTQKRIQVLDKLYRYQTDK